MLKVSHYNVEIASSDGERRFIYNTVNNRIMEVSPSVADSMRLQTIEHFSPLLKQTLSYNGMLVPADANEGERAINAVRKRRNHKDVRLIVIPEYSCNLRCPYCYEGEIPQTAEKGALNSRWVDSVCNMIDELLREPECPGCTLGFYGGEPLLAADDCLQIARFAKDRCKTLQQKFYCTLTTNGAILNNNVQELLHYVDSVQVTFDGVGKEHNRRRPTAGGKGTYERILRFLEACESANVPHTAIRFHVHEYTPDYLRICAATLLQDLGDGRQKIYFANVECGFYQQLMRCNKDATTEDTSHRIHAAHQAFLAAGWDKRRVFIDNKSTPHIPNIGCGMVGAKTLLVDNLGNMYFCPVAVKNSTMSLGSFSEDGPVYKALRKRLTTDWVPPALCQTCRVFPLCESGCYAKALFTHGDMFKPFCEDQRIHGILRRRCAQHANIDPAALDIITPLQQPAAKSRDTNPQLSPSPTSTTLKESIYNVHLKWDSGHAGIFNTLTGASVTLPKSFSRADRLSIGEIPRTLRETMARLGLLAPRDTDELKEYTRGVATGPASDCVELAFISARSTSQCDDPGMDQLAKWKSRVTALPGKLKFRFCGYASRPLAQRLSAFASLTGKWNNPIGSLAMWMSDSIHDIVQCTEINAAAQFYEWDLRHNLKRAALNEICEAIHNLANRRRYVQVQLVADNSQTVMNRKGELCHAVQHLADTDLRYLNWSVRLTDTAEILYYTPDVCLPQTPERLRRQRDVIASLRALGIPVIMPLNLRQFHGGCPYTHPSSAIITHDGEAFRCLRKLTEPKLQDPPSRAMDKCQVCPLDPWCSAQCPYNALTESRCSEQFRLLAIKTEPF